MKEITELLNLLHGKQSYNKFVVQARVYRSNRH